MFHSLLPERCSKGHLDTCCVCCCYKEHKSQVPTYCAASCSKKMRSRHNVVTADTKCSTTSEIALWQSVTVGLLQHLLLVRGTPIDPATHSITYPLPMCSVWRWVQLSPGGCCSSCWSLYRTCVTPVALARVTHRHHHWGVGCVKYIKIRLQYTCIKIHTPPAKVKLSSCAPGTGSKEKQIHAVLPGQPCW